MPSHQTNESENQPSPTKGSRYQEPFALRTALDNLLNCEQQAKFNADLENDEEGEDFDNDGGNSTLSESAEQNKIAKELHRLKLQRLQRQQQQQSQSSGTAGSSTPNSPPSPSKLGNMNRRNSSSSLLDHNNNNQSSQLLAMHENARNSKPYPPTQALNQKHTILLNELALQEKFKESYPQLLELDAFATWFFVDQLASFVVRLRDFKRTELSMHERVRVVASERRSLEEEECSVRTTLQGSYLQELRLQGRLMESKKSLMSSNEYKAQRGRVTRQLDMLLMDAVGSVPE